MDNKVIIFSAPSGAGKSTVVNHILSLHPELEFSVSATSRAPRGTEQNGKEYYFFSADEFRQMIAQDKFVEHEEVYPGSFYGTLKSEVRRIWDKGHVIIFDIDVRGGVNLKRIFGENAFSIFIQAPSVEELRNRLVRRGTDSAEAIEKRVAKAAEEIEFAAGKFDYTLVNDDLDTALKEAERVVDDFLSDNIAVYPGSFNPLHIGHKAIMEHLVGKAGFDRVYLIVSPKNPLKDGISADTGRSRYEAAVEAVSRNALDFVKVDDIELGMHEPHYTIRTLDALAQREPHSRFTLVIGADQLSDIRRWKDYRRILCEYGVAVYPRTGYNLEEIRDSLMAECSAEAASNLEYKITLLDAPKVDISSSEIRKETALGHDMSAFLM